MTFSLSCLTKLPQTLVLRELALGFRLWCHTNLFLTVASPPQRARSPLTFQAEHSEAVPWGASVPRAGAGCSASTAVSQPTSQPALPGAGQSASAWDYRKPLPNPQLSGLSCWHLPIFHTEFHTLESARIILESEGSRGRAVDVRVVQCGAAREPARLFLLSLSIFHCSRWSTSRDPQHKKEITRFGFPVCY